MVIVPSPGDAEQSANVCVSAGASSIEIKIVYLIQRCLRADAR